MSKLTLVHYLALNKLWVIFTLDILVPLTTETMSGVVLHAARDAVTIKWKGGGGSSGKIGNLSGVFGVLKTIDYTEI